MTCFTDVHTAQSNFRNLIRAVALNKWNTVSTAHLTLIASLINQKIDADTMISLSYGHMWGAYIYSQKDNPIRKMIGELTRLTENDIKLKVAAFKIFEGQDLVKPVAQMSKAPLEDKRAYLRTAQVISTTVSAAYLGITAGVLSKFTASHRNVIGGRYARGYCLSMDEVFLIEQNPQWLAGDVSHEHADEVKAVDANTFDYLVFVGEDVACAFTDMEPSELRKAVKVGAQTLRPYRLSDLEKIRVAKLNSIYMN
jgi:hypothetical protein